MLYPIIVVRKRCPSVVRWIDVNALDLASELLLQGFEGEEIVAKNEAVVEDVTISHSMRGMIRLFRVLQQNARLQLGPVVFANPGEFEFLLAGHG
jgi:hypothetical protein